VSDAWDQILARPLKGRRLRAAALEGREKGLQEFEKQFGSEEAIDVNFIEERRDLIERNFRMQIILEVSKANLGLSVSDLEPHARRLATVHLKEMLDAARALS
jgi:hypothetical protein